MSKDYAQIANDVITGVGMLRQGSPDAMKAFASLAVAGTASNAIDTKTKELMALAIGIAIHCEDALPTIRRWRTSTARRDRRSSKPSPSPSTWEAGRRRSMVAMRCAPMTNSAENAKSQ